MSQVLRKNTLGLVATALLLASCGPLISIGDDGPADIVYTLRFQGGYANDNTGPVVFMDEPTVADGLEGNKIAVALEGNRRTAIEGVRWSAPASDLVRDYLLRSLGANTDARMVGEGALDIQTACRLGVRLWELEYIPGARAADDRVSIAFELTLVRQKDNNLLGHPTVTKSVEVGGSGADEVMAAFDRAMAQAAAEATAWFSAAYKACDEG